jgi:chaperonin GroES
VTARNAGSFIEKREDEAGFYEVFIITASADPLTIFRVIPWTTSEEIPLMEGTLWVRPRVANVSEFIIDVDPPRETEGEVVRLGPPGTHPKTGEVIPWEIEVGSVVVFTPYTGVELEVGGEKMMVMKEGEILAVIRGESK